jgi:hypothetical protein
LLSTIPLHQLPNGGGGHAMGTSPRLDQFDRRSQRCARSIAAM